MVVTQTVTGPTRPPRLGGLNGVAEFETVDRLGYTEKVSWVSDPCGFPMNAIGLCWEESSADFPKAGMPVETESAIDKPFALYGGVECFLGADNDFDERARVILEQGEGAALEGRIGAWASAAPPVPGIGTLLEALAGVECSMDAEYLGRGVIFVNRGDAVILSASGALIPGVSGAITTINGTPVVSSAAIGQGLIAGTGAIKVLTTPILSHSAVKHRTNVEMSIAERSYAILVDCSYRVQAYAPVP